jgi:hypothetical protein
MTTMIATETTVLETPVDLQQPTPSGDGIGPVIVTVI